MADSERDTASCSGGDEDSRSGLHSPSASEDSVEVQVTPISLRNKRKLAEPRKIQEPSTAPLKKRRYHRIEETTVVVDEESRSMSTPSPFRPWIISCTSGETPKTSTTASITAISSATTTTTTTTTMMTTTTTTTSTTSATSPTKMTSVVINEQAHAAMERRKRDDACNQDETMQRLQESLRRIQQTTSQNRSVVLSRREPRHRYEPAVAPPTSPTKSTTPTVSLPHPRLQEEPLSLVIRDEALRVPSHPAVSGTYEKTPSYMMEHLLAASTSSQDHRNDLSPQQDQQCHHTTVAASSSSSTSSSHARHHQQGGGGGGGGGGCQQRNYKNMTRERRIEANARERTRVHTISAAFDTLRRAIPAYSHNQKLSKLSVLRIACSYIVTLTKVRKMLDGDTTSGGASLAACVDQVSRTIQTEGKLRKRKDD